MSDYVIPNLLHRFAATPAIRPIAASLLSLALVAGSVTFASPALAQDRARAKEAPSGKPSTGKARDKKAMKSRGGPPKAKAGRKGPPGGRRGRPTFVGVDKVILGELQQTEPVIGRMVIRQGGIVAARAAGAVLKITVHVGDRVKKGSVLAVVDAETARARLAFQKAELKIAKQELERFERLRSSSSAAFAKGKYDDALQRVARAIATMRIAQIVVNNSTIRAPYPGVITKRHTDLGAYLNIGAPVVTIVNDSNLEIEADVPADRIAGLSPGAKIGFTLPSGLKKTATVRAVIPEQNMRTRTLAVRLTPPVNTGAVRWAVNQPVTLHVPIGKARKVVSVHKDAVINRGPTNLVYVLVGVRKSPRPVSFGKAIPRPVQLGDAIGSRFVVKSGLKPGDIVVVRGNERLRPGQPVLFRTKS